MSARILVVDNYDSFVFNLVQYLYQLGAECEVLRNDEVRPAHAQDGFDGVLLSPGPGTPEEAGVCVDMVRHCAETGVPVFGVCLGMQSMRGGVRRSRRPGARAAARQDLAGDSTRAAASSPDCRRRSPRPATTRWPSSRQHRAGRARGHRLDGDGIIMGLRHRELPVEGVQFHPESVLTEHGHRMLANWLAECGDHGRGGRSAGLAPVVGQGGGVTALRPERPADGPMSYEDTGQFEAVVEQLDDPLNDPLPGRPPAVRTTEPAFTEPVRRSRSRTRRRSRRTEPPSRYAPEPAGRRAASPRSARRAATPRPAGRRPTPATPGVRTGAGPPAPARSRPRAARRRRAETGPPGRTASPRAGRRASPADADRAAGRPAAGAGGRKAAQGRGHRRSAQRPGAAREARRPR